MAEQAPQNLDAPILSELGPNGLPLEPPAGDDSPRQDADLIMDTFFGDDSNPSSDQASRSNDDGGQEPSSLARSDAAPAANGEDDDREPGSSSTQQREEQGPVAGEGSQTPAPKQPDAAVSQPATEPSAEQRLRDAEFEALKRTNEALLARLEAKETGAAQDGQGQPAKQTDAGKEEIQRLSVPDPLFAMIMDEDPAKAKAGVDMLITTVAHVATQKALAAVPQLVQAQLGGLTAQAEQQKQVSDMEESYYAAYPSHKNPLFRPLISQVTQEKFKLFPHAEWDDTMIASVGATVTERLKALNIDPSVVSDPAAGGGEEQQPKPKAKPKPKPAPMLDASTRGEGEPQDAGDFMRATFG